MKDNADLLVVSDHLADALVLEEKMWQWGVGAVVAVFTTQEWLHAILTTLPAIIVLDLRLSPCLLHHARRSLGGDGPGVGPAVVFVIADHGFIGYLPLPTHWYSVTVEALALTVQRELQYLAQRSYHHLLYE